jgi:hypothetical protein
MVKKIFNGLARLWNGLFFGARIVKVKIRVNEDENYAAAN